MSLGFVPKGCDAVLQGRQVYFRRFHGVSQVLGQSVPQYTFPCVILTFLRGGCRAFFGGFCTGAVCCGLSPFHIRLSGGVGRKLGQGRVMDRPAHRAGETLF